MYKANVTRVTNLFLLDKDQNANREKKEREREGRMCFILIATKEFTAIESRRILLTFDNFEWSM